MAMTLAEAKVRQKDGAAVIDLTGDINGAAEPALTGGYEEAIKSDPKKILINFGGAEYINSTGIALIVGLLARARKEGREVVACGLSEHYRHIFEITRLADFMHMYADEAAALSNTPS